VASGDCQYQQVKGINVLTKILLSPPQQSASVGEEANPASCLYRKSDIRRAGDPGKHNLGNGLASWERRKQSVEGQSGSTTPTTLNKETNTPIHGGRNLAPRVHSNNSSKRAGGASIIPQGGRAGNRM